MPSRNRQVEKKNEIKIEIKIYKEIEWEGGEKLKVTALSDRIKKSKKQQLKD